MIFEIINPSDCYLMEAPDLEVAAVAVSLLGEGQYGLREMDMETGQEKEDGAEVPILLWGIEQWFQKTFKKDLEAVLKHTHDERKDELIACFLSVVIGDAKERAFYLSAVSKIDDPEKKAAFAAEWHDKKRSSMNDIGGRAQRWAERLSKEKKKEEVASA